MSSASQMKYRLGWLARYVCYTTQARQVEIYTRLAAPDTRRPQVLHMRGRAVTAPVYAPFLALSMQGALAQFLAVEGRQLGYAAYLPHTMPEWVKDYATGALQALPMQHFRELQVGLP